MEGVVPPHKEVVKDKASAPKHLVDQRRLLLRRIDAKAESFMMQHAGFTSFGDFMIIIAHMFVFMHKRC
ncbi:hypothetical protein ET33_27550 [Paenibacillus tyrfis]|uniref:Uncharacterized protein n=1 Tax=Paenibacillus tyrfis TaxID=1501230 RepID=A0A081NUJ6_9BACL|nr:hypothetical protein ET33_27550 [Paenibacillus tyrfis]